MAETMIPILFEDTEMLVINKPAGITVNRSDTTKNDTIQDWAEEKLKISSKGQSSSEDDKPIAENVYANAFYDRGGIVHRLDKETSGVLVIAKNPEAFLAVQHQFKERKVEKKYQALVHGIVTPAIGEIRAPVGRLPWNRTQFGIVAGGRDSVTLYKRLAVYELPRTRGGLERGSLLELTPQTGRTHQIRVHLKYIGHPIFADFLYAGRKTARDDRKFLERVFLHAQSLSFSHPKTGEVISLRAPLPVELENVLLSLKRVE
jgi:23S rRNA pseudouridine1911/1915/1917 synthase